MSKDCRSQRAVQGVSQRVASVAVGGRYRGRRCPDSAAVFSATVRVAVADGERRLDVDYRSRLHRVGRGSRISALARTFRVGVGCGGPQELVHVRGESGCSWRCCRRWYRCRLVSALSHCQVTPEMVPSGVGQGGGQGPSPLGTGTTIWIRFPARPRCTTLMVTVMLATRVRTGRSAVTVTV